MKDFRKLSIAGLIWSVIFFFFDLYQTVDGHHHGGLLTFFAICTLIQFVAGMCYAYWAAA